MTADQFDDIIEDIMTSTWESGRVKIINLCKQMCDKQKQICADNSRLIPVKKYGTAYNSIDLDSIINSPYPEELL